MTGCSAARYRLLKFGKETAAWLVRALLGQLRQGVHGATGLSEAR